MKAKTTNITRKRYNITLCLLTVREATEMIKSHGGKLSTLLQYLLVNHIKSVKLPRILKTKN